ncbi:MAG TPA: phosphatidate cytidylyltransferase [Myxococcota bacterium]|nr:phosphatidate cytidylyltransferase [Myxococcota bacterium]
MIVKVVTGVILSAAIIAAIVLAPSPVLAGIIAVIFGMAAWEFAALAKGRRIDSAMALIGSVSVIVVSALLGDSEWLFPVVQTVFVAGMLGLIVVLLTPHPIENAGHRAAMVVTAIVYVGVAGAICVRMIKVPDEVAMVGRWAVLTAGVITWLNDTMAYFGGKLFGRSKMYPAISPNKTWAGSISGMIGSIGGVFAIRAIFGIDYPWLPLLGLGIVGGVLGQLGDLAESMFKRSAGVKDSGNLLPGHGGMLDRIDAFLFVAPITWLWLFVWFPVGL